MQIQNIKEKLGGNKRLVFLFILGLLGILLLGLSEILPSQTEKTPEKEEKSGYETSASSMEYCEALEHKLETVLKEMEGVGRVKVLLTLESSDEKIYAMDEKTNSKNSNSSAERTFDSKYVRTDSKNGDEGIVLKTNAPKIKGVVIVCDGGNDSVVANGVTAAVSSALGIGSNAVSVLKMKA